MGRAWWRGLSRVPWPCRPALKSCAVSTRQSCFQCAVVSDPFQQLSCCSSLSFLFSSFPLPSFCLSSSFSLFLKGSSCLYPLEFSEHSVKKPAFFTCAKISQGQERVDVKLKDLYKSRAPLVEDDYEGSPQNWKTWACFSSNYNLICSTAKN